MTVVYSRFVKEFILITNSFEIMKLQYNQNSKNNRTWEKERHKNCMYIVEPRYKVEYNKLLL